MAAFCDLTTECCDMRNPCAEVNSLLIVRRNVIYERARFNSRVQKDGGSIETFLTDLYALIENCEYENFKPKGK